MENMLKSCGEAFFNLVMSNVELIVWKCSHISLRAELIHFLSEMSIYRCERNKCPITLSVIW